MRVVGYAVVAFLLAGCLVSGAVTIVAQGRDSTFNPWVVGSAAGRSTFSAEYRLPTRPRTGRKLAC
jgi:hypothetical protein